MADTLKIGDRVFITDPKHPWHSKAGEVVSALETYGLGWKGHRVRIDETCGQEAYVNPEQVMGPGRVTKMTITMRKVRKRPTP